MNMSNFGDKNRVRGIVVLFGGIFLLLYTLGLIEKGINLLFIGTAIAMIVYGASSSGIDTFVNKGVRWVLSFFKKKQ